MTALMFKLKQKTPVGQTTLITDLTLPLHSPVLVASGSLLAPTSLIASEFQRGSVCHVLQSQHSSIPDLKSQLPSRFMVMVEIEGMVI